MVALTCFNAEQIVIVGRAADLAEELVNDFYKMSSSQWLHQRYDIKTLRELTSEEIVHGPFAQVVRYQAQKKDSFLGSAYYDFYKICLQDHTICSVLEPPFEMPLYPLMVYIIVHELVHIVRFSKFLQSFQASEDEKMQEEARVHRMTRLLLKPFKSNDSNDSTDFQAVFTFFKSWHTPLDTHHHPSKISHSHLDIPKS